MEHYLATNLKVLRKLKGFSADIVSNALDMKRSTLSSYEQGASEPSITNLLKLGGYYRVSLDILIEQDLRAWPGSRIAETQACY